MDTAQFQIYGSLNFFLPRHQRNTRFKHRFDWRGSIKDMVESLGVPHAEIDLLVVNGQSVGFSYLVCDGDQIDVYPDFDAVDLPKKIQLRPPYPGRPRFVLDTHLGRLASYLRMMGFDTLYRNDYPDDELARVSHDEQRIVLTRDVGVLKRSLVIYGYYVRSIDPRERIIEIIRRYDLVDDVQPFRFCLKCNGSMEQVEKKDIEIHISIRTKKYYDEFHRCKSCQQIFWKGSHYQKMQDFIKGVLDEL